MSTDLTFAEYEELAQRTDVAPAGDPKSLVVPLLGLAGEVGSLLSEHKKYLREGDRYRMFTDHVSEEIGDILWYLANIAAKSGLSLAEVALENLAKLEAHPSATATHRPSRRRVEPIRFDAKFPAGQRLPRKLRVVFHEFREPQGTKLEMLWDGHRLGDPLTDNAHIDDGYRFHDVFHLSNAILLGWSPVTRALLKVKRKADVRVDEVEDGARAGVTEEAISALVFAHARDHAFYAGASSVDFEILKTIAMMIRPFEVRVHPPRVWEAAILQAYAVWRNMRDHRGGVFLGDAEAATVAYEAPPADRPSQRRRRPSTRRQR